jgi:hypothetical protein
MLTTCGGVGRCRDVVEGTGAPDARWGWRRPGGAVSVVILAALLVACGGGAPSAEPVDLVVDVALTRAAQALGVLHVQLSTLGDTPVEVRSLELRDARFSAVDATPKSTTVEPGGRPVLTPMDYGEVVCEDVTGPARLAVTVDTAGGVQELVLPVEHDGQEALTRLHESACRERAVGEAATIRFGDDWEPTDPAVARGRIVVERAASDDEIVIAQAEGTVILSLTVLDGPDEEVLTLAPGQRSAEVAVEVSAARCDPHALIESKRTYSFPLWVRVGDTPTTYLTLEPDGPARAVMEGLLASGCGLDH